MTDIKQCVECGVIYKSDNDVCPACEAVVNYMHNYPEIFIFAENEISELHEWMDAETGLNVPPIVIAAMYRRIKLCSRN